MLTARQDCGLYVNDISGTHATKDCAQWDDSGVPQCVQENQLKQFALAQTDTLAHWFFRMRKIAPDNTGVKAPLWSCQLGLQNGWLLAIHAMRRECAQRRRSRGRTRCG